MGETSPTKAARSPGALGRFARWRLLDRALSVALVVGIAAAAAAALSPGLLAQRIPYEEKDLGNVATATIKANRAYDIPDEETTRRMRDEAVAAVRAVYEHDAAAGDAIAARIRDGFAFARSYLAEQRAEAGRQGGRDAPSRGMPLDSVRDELERRLGARLEEEELGALSRADFAPGVEDVVVGLVGQAMGEMVVGDREELAQHRSRGIAIRRIGRGGVIEEALTEIGGIRDLASARARIEVGAESLAGMPKELKQAAVNLARREVRSNLKYDPDLTRKRREDAAAAVKPVAIQLKKGEKIIGDGERIEARHLAIFQGMRAQSQEIDLLQVRFGGGLFAMLLSLGLFAFAKAGFVGFRLSRKDRFLLASLLVGMLFLAHLGLVISDVLRERTPGIPPEAFTYAFPFAAGAMLVRFVLGSEAAILFAVAFSALVGILTGNSLSFGLFALLGSLAGATRVVGARDRGGLFRAGMVAGFVQAAAVLCFALFAGQILSWDVLLDATAAAVGGAVFTPMLLLALIALTEGLLGYTTDLRLLELANLNHPA
ncbi:MAG TPA: phosphohydrolase, partial [Vulgatibacter sp.]